MLKTELSIGLGEFLVCFDLPFGKGIVTPGFDGALF
jgi:hypothetical protein